MGRKTEVETARGKPGAAEVLCDAMVGMTEGLCALPGVPTADWLDRAAKQLICPNFPSAALAALVKLDATGAVVQIFALGLAGQTPLPGGRPRRGSSPGDADTADTILELRGRTQALVNAHWSPSGRHRDIPNGVIAARTDWRDSPHSHLWRGLGSPNILAGAAWIDQHRGHAAIVYRALAVDYWPEHAAAMKSTAILLARLLRRAFGTGPYSSAAWLTRAEGLVLGELVLGKTVREIAQSLGKSPHTIHDYVKVLHQKLGATSRGGLIARAVGLAGGLGTRESDSIVEAKPRPRSLTR